jgi:hypothetical protein
MKRSDILDRLAVYKGGGVSTDEAVPSYQYYLSRLHSMREFALREEFRRDGVINPANYQNHWLEYDEELNQDDCRFYLFRCPRILQLTNRDSGFGYVGSEDGMSQYNLFTSPERFAVAQGHRFTKLGNKISAAYDWEEEMMKLNQPVKRGLVRAVFLRPEDVPTFNVDIDDYPFSAKGLEILEEAISKGTINYILRVPQDKVSNGNTDADLLKTPNR